MSTETTSPRPRDAQGRFIPRSEVEVEVVAPETPAQNFWQEKGFLDDISRLCHDLENQPQRFIYSANMRSTIQIVNNARHVEDFAEYSNDQIDEMLHDIRTTVPSVEREITGFTGQLSRARSVQNDYTDFI